MQRFEYLTVYLNSSGYYQALPSSWRPLTELGEQGWELVSVVYDSSDLIAFLKRRQENGK